LHMVFTGNPGTGKTTVARILGKIYGAMGILTKGHLIETDRSGLVAEYAGQTGPKSNRLIDQALDGVLFIDEAYSLVAEKGDDPYGAEAVQALLKRMEDHRDQLVVILAGYPEEVERMLKSNPGLSSRFNRRVNFPDYSPGELAQIFFRMCQLHEYVIEKEAFARLLVGLNGLYLKRDKYFGNGRLARNLFEGAIRHLANRIVLYPEVDRKQLTQFLPEDICFEGLPEELLNSATRDEMRFGVTCPKCENKSKSRAKLLGCRVQCGQCREDFTIDLAEPILATDDSNNSEDSLLGDA
ncbi:MAG: AAA family ATPase, partial [Pirellulaceae bacterium]